MAYSKAASCFVAIPSAAEFTQVRESINRVLRDSDVSPLNPANGPTEFSSDLLERADFVIADVTGSDKFVLYALGAATSLRKPIFMMAQQQGDLPSDLASQQVILYRLEDLEKLGAYLRDWIPDLIALQRKKYAM
jgi:hypothetical protein